MAVLTTPLDHPAKALCAIYALRTVALLLLAWSTTYIFPQFSPLGYDTSSTHVTGYGGTFPFTQDAPPFSTDLVGRLVTALTRWDVIYFEGIARRGYRWEQEWAFGIGQSYLLQGFRTIHSLISTAELGAASQIIFFSTCSCVSHLVSAIVLFHLTTLLFQSAQLKGRKPGQDPVRLVAFVAASLHVLSPAGIFLIAPYNEAIFSALSFLGYWSYSSAIKSTAPDGKHSWKNEILLLSSAALFGVSSLFRSNGVINGVLFAFEFSQSLWRLISGINPSANLRLFVASGAAGALVGVPVLWRQYVGWLEYCSSETDSLSREWCSKSLPSVYNFVQSHYWGVGFLKYWTPGNIPLFLLAVPMLFVLLRTTSDIFATLTPATNRLYSLPLVQTNRDLLFRLSVPQLLLATLAITNYHVQIITRLSSGLPIWYIVTAAALVQTAETQYPGPGDVASESGKTAPETSSSVASWHRPAIRFFLGYQIVQAILYGGFLPPA
ncbi:hypothetical protein DRE_06093 [Drechslerella stenobrocha 248]|uniref:GPI mannosyltransferase 2 n=1 Tax=Drechslerella stenobrocha 248 TaxID=1043628 RepID=W7I876_9PEZI|nr:hypothetical protein DRE_06093 [Drechslerella stenobrocha 248]